MQNKAFKGYQHLLLAFIKGSILYQMRWRSSPSVSFKCCGWGCL